MKYGIQKKQPTGWRFTGWRACGDLHVGDLQGVPRWFRCVKCNSLVTHAMVKAGGCFCGNRRLHPAMEITWGEVLALKLGRYPLDTREHMEVGPLFGAPA